MSPSRAGIFGVRQFVVIIGIVASLSIATPGAAAPIVTFDLSGTLTFSSIGGSYFYKDLADRVTTFTGGFSYDVGAITGSGNETTPALSFSLTAANDATILSFIDAGDFTTLNELYLTDGVPTGFYLSGFQSPPLFGVTPTLYIVQASLLAGTGYVQLIGSSQQQAFFSDIVATPATANPIPEPATLFLFGTGLVAATARRRLSHRRT